MKILHLDHNHDILPAMLQEAGHENHHDYTARKSEIEKIISKYDGLVVRSRFPIDAQFLSHAGKLQCIGRVGAGLENIDLQYAQDRDITCFNAPEGNRNAVGEHALGMLLALFNKLHTADREVRDGLWRREENRGLELDGKTIGIIGYGNMGNAFAKKLQGFDCEVLCHDLKPDLSNKYATQVDLQTLQEECDVVSLHTPENTSTIGMVNREFIDRFRKSIYLINTARGSAVVTSDLVEALQSGKISGAGLDVLEYEKSSFESLFQGDSMPVAMQELINMDQVLLSPHVAGWTVESKKSLAKVIADKMIQYFNK
jgi:D-3-phosphoglycerate dehydrogenase